MINSFINTHGSKIALFSSLLLILLFLYTCNINSKLKSFTKSGKQTQQKLDSLLILNKNTNDSLVVEISRLMELEGYRISKRNLYNENAIIRTKMRPDDVMNEYDKEIKRLSK